jgi:hypothetical protein
MRKTAIIAGGLVWCSGQNKRIAPLTSSMDVVKASKGLIAFTPETPCDQTAIC